jgi:hypothetical protein
MLHAWEEETRLSYSAGLLMWHCFCDSKGLPEAERAPASQALLSAFVAHMASAYLGKTISSYLHGVRAWHILHGLPWVLEKGEMDTMLQAADKLTLQNDDPDLRGNAASPTGPDQAEGPEGTSRVPADDPKL